MQIIISGKGVDLTDAIESYVTKKINVLDKYMEGIIRADVVLGMETKHHVKGDKFFAECKLEVPGNDLFYREVGSDLYAAIDEMRTRLEGELKKRKGKVKGNLKKKKVASRNNKEYHE